MEDHNELDEEFLGREEDLEFDTEDVTISEKESIPSISFSKKIRAQLVKPWMNAVVAKLLGRTIGYRALCNRLNDLWKMSQGFSVIDFFLFRFKTEGDAHYALTQGPWTILGHYLTVQQWNPHFNSSNDNIDNIVAWIRLLGMPLHYYHKRVRMIGNVVGKVIRIHYNTESLTRGKFARIAVEVSLNKPLCSHFCLDGKMQKVEYENLPVISFNCGIYGHKNENCPQLKTIKGATKNSENNGVGNITKSGGDKLWSSTVIPTNPSFRP
ncbi:uncharacterized protein LOC127899817 [Citrus sinensis]|uniref:uncharacterized protein LOC127899817 n=1 Tax=Citrus sinensis TaxID=2711 RepID=UPI002278B2A7|nr:uncharacterized protein LOC127899817 [Citrus sinensis]